MTKLMVRIRNCSGFKPSLRGVVVPAGIFNSHEPLAADFCSSPRAAFITIIVSLPAQEMPQVIDAYLPIHIEKPDRAVVRIPWHPLVANAAKVDVAHFLRLWVRNAMTHPGLAAAVAHFHVYFTVTLAHKRHANAHRGAVEFDRIAVACIRKGKHIAPQRAAAVSSGRCIRRCRLCSRHWRRWLRSWRRCCRPRCLRCW